MFMKILMILKLYALMAIRSDCFIDSHHPCNSIHTNRFSDISRGGSAVFKCNKRWYLRSKPFDNGTYPRRKKF